MLPFDFRYSNLSTKQDLCLAYVDGNDIDLKTLKVIHVSGTKGKGSTCRMLESILLSHGYHTGSYSTPAFFSEYRTYNTAIRVDGVAITGERYKQIEDRVTSRHHISKQYHNHFEAFSLDGDLELENLDFKVALDVFLQEKVDVAIIEVCIGGRDDCTNVFKHPVAVGITLVDFAHTDRLGKTLREIAGHKAGIMKHGCPAFTISGQPDEVLEILEKEAQQLQIDVDVVKPTPEEWKLGIRGEHQRSNAGLAIALAQTFMQSVKVDISLSPNDLSEKTQEGLAHAFLPLRCQWCQISPKLTAFVDGAHTVKSIGASVSEWNKLSMHLPKDCRMRILLLYVKSGSDLAMLSALSGCTTPFDQVWSISLFETCWQVPTIKWPQSIVNEACRVLNYDSKVSVKVFDQTSCCIDALLKICESKHVAIMLTGSFFHGSDFFAELHYRNILNREISKTLGIEGIRSWRDDVRFFREDIRENGRTYHVKIKSLIPYTMIQFGKQSQVPQTQEEDDI